MRLGDLPLIAEGLQQILDDCGCSGPRRVDRHALLPGKWEEWFLEVERMLGFVTGKRLESVFYGKMYPRWLGQEDSEFQPAQLALEAVYYSVDDSPVDILRALGVASEEQIEKVQRLFNEFFDGNDEHEELNRLFVTTEAT